jgi:hypothetical protein
MLIQSPEELAHAVNTQLQLGLTARPWNWHEPHSTFWWLVPSGEWPAYRHGKLAFSLTKDDARKTLLGVDDSLLHTESIFAGFTVEKGYDQAAMFANSALRNKPAQLMDPTWVWWKVVRGNGPDQFAQTLRAASTTSPLYLYVVTSPVHDRDSTTPPQRDAIMFVCDAGGIKAVLKRFSVGTLVGADQAIDFPSLAERLRSIDGYHWVDLYVGTHVSRGDVDVKKLHQDTLSYFDHWVVPAHSP